MQTPKPYLNPFLAGIGLGLVLLSAFVVMGRGLGASGALSSVVTFGVNTIAPEHARANTFYKEYLNTTNGNPLNDWLVFEIVGVLIGGLISGLLSGRVNRTIDKGIRATNSTRFFYAFCGGLLVGIGSKLARGCTSGQALTGGALLSVGSWVFMLAVFASAYAVAYFFKKQWT
ncbi:MAG: YeeE/YedE family protein [Ignavibacteriae bacterium]|nr:YeeE/YedE family protein [Ignavibacteriota bacterium]